MLNYTEKRKIRTIIYSPAVVVVLLLLLVVTGRAAWGMYGKYREATAKQAEAEREWEKMSIREKELQSAISRLSHERGIEEEIREKYMVAKEGEQVIVVTDVPGPDESNVVRTVDESSWWTSFLGSLGLGGK